MKNIHASGNEPCGHHRHLMVHYTLTHDCYLINTVSAYWVKFELFMSF